MQRDRCQWHHRKASPRLLRYRHEHDSRAAIVDLSAQTRYFRLCQKRQGHHPPKPGEKRWKQTSDVQAGPAPKIEDDMNGRSTESGTHQNDPKDKDNA
ncbi:uncharacterized protein G6M90_00g081750 [Metarhizium brunneum]|uniref:Uncharacterized protein n=1 Tax=Metarhizium brunneum TaxID=500148 RepID=A0A7D5V3Z7_9HYPO|nr:hypothetical protein G6M90_00g081750 [Metarhizium brunneum]